MATNEELALLIQQGHKEYISELWANCYKLLYMLVDKIYYANPDRLAACGYTQEDLYQGSFFVLLKMIEAYDPEKPFKFTSYAKLHLQNYFRRSVLHYDSEAKIIKSVLNISSSIDKPIGSGEDEELTVGSLIKDDNAELAFENVEEDIYRTELHNALEQGIQTLSQPQRIVIRERFYNSSTLKGAAEALGMTESQAHSHETNALKALRTYNAKTKQLECFRADIIDTAAYGGVGVGAFKNRQASSVEYTTELLEERKQHHNDKKYY